MSKLPAIILGGTRLNFGSVFEADAEAGRFLGCDSASSGSTFTSPSVLLPLAFDEAFGFFAPLAFALGIPLAFALDAHLAFAFGTAGAASEISVAVPAVPFFAAAFLLGTAFFFGVAFGVA